MCLQIIYLIYTYKENLVLSCLQWFICHKTQPADQLTITLRELSPKRFEFSNNDLQDELNNV